jgi:two-component system alkaline phosphatase synthesis response regulator PhoP
MMKLDAEIKGIDSRQDEIMIIDEDSGQTAVLASEFIRQHYRVRVAADGRTGLAEIQKEPPGLVILDPMVSKPHGWEICRLIKASPRSGPVPVVILTKLNREETRLRGFEMGADDYLTKPYSLKELIARVRALFRRVMMNRRHEETGHLQLGDLFIDTENHEARIAGRVLKLTHTEFTLLKHLARHPGRVFTRDQLIDVVWGEDQFVEYRNVDVHVYSLRKRLEVDPARPVFLLTVRGIGYKLTSG